MKKILLVEDDPEITRLLDLHLNSGPYQLSACNNGEEAIRKISSEEFHLVIVDIMLPGINGMEVCKKLRERNYNTPIMMLTALSEESDKILALELGADEYITKPFGILELMARTKALFRRSDHQSNTSAALPKEIVYRDLEIDKNKRKLL